MSETKKTSRVIILVKAFPLPSKKYVETVCCAGVTGEGVWKRLFPIRFRQMSEDQRFKRWNVIQFDYRTPSDDNRPESCRVYEGSVSVVGHFQNPNERARLISRAIVSSEKEAVAKGHSLAIIEPRDVRFHYKKRAFEEITAIKKEVDR